MGGHDKLFPVRFRYPPFGHAVRTFTPGAVSSITSPKRKPKFNGSVSLLLTTEISDDENTDGKLGCGRLFAAATTTQPAWYARSRRSWSGAKNCGLVVPRLRLITWYRCLIAYSSPARNAWPSPSPPAPSTLML